MTCDAWDSIIDDIDFIELETTHKSLIDRIITIQYAQNGIILVTSKNGQVLMFSNSGKLLYSFDGYGKGSNELLHIMGAQLTNDNYLYIFGTQKYFKVDNRGQIIRNSSLPISKNFPQLSCPVDWFMDENQTFYQWYTPDGTLPEKARYSLIITDSVGNEISKNLRYNHYAGGSKHFFQGDQITLLAPPILNDTIYEIYGAAIHPKYFVNFGNNKYIHGAYSIEKQSDIDNPFHLVNYLKKYRICNSIMKPVMNEGYLIFRFSSTEGWITCIYNKYTKQSTLINCFQENSNSLFTPGLLMTSNHNKFISYIDAWKIRQFLDEGKTECTFLSEKRRLELLDKIKDVKETDNPVLMVIKTKNNQ